MATVKDVARSAQVSVSTVSLVLNNKPNVSAETRGKVLACMRDLDFRPNIMARGIRTQTSGTIGIMVPTITNPVYPNIVNAIEAAARQENYSVILCSYSADRAADGVTDSLARLFDRMVDGIIICGIPAMPDTHGEPAAASLMAAYIARRIPFVFLSDTEQHSQFMRGYAIDQQQHGALFQVLSIDRTKASQRAVEHLIRTGHRRIALVGEESSDSYPHTIPFMRKLEGYKRALHEHGLPFDPTLVVADTADFAGGKRCFERLVNQTHPPAAIFCTGDVMALGALRAASELKFTIPGQLAIIGFDNIPQAAFSNPALSTVALPFQDMAQEAFRRLSRMMQGATVLPAHMQFDTELVLRESCL